jgi:hypothetical protein
VVADDDPNDRPTPVDETADDAGQPTAADRDEDRRPDLLEQVAEAVGDLFDDAGDASD